MAQKLKPTAGTFVPSWAGPSVAQSPTTLSQPVILKRERPPPQGHAVLDLSAPMPSSSDKEKEDPAVASAIEGVENLKVRSPSPVAPFMVSPVDSPSASEPEIEMEKKVEKKTVTPPPMLCRKKHVNIVFIGHVDAGKSTISGHLLHLTGEVDDRTLDKYEKEAAATSRESWKYAWALDVTEGERAKGKTEECGRAHFETAERRYTILDAPGHRNYVPFMIGGASQADIGVLVVSARKGEFETGFDRGGQTREHAMLAKTAGVKQLVIAINKMDDPTVQWSKERYDEIVGKITPFLKSVGYNPKHDISFVPISGFAGMNNNLLDPLDKSIVPWWDGPTLIKILDSFKEPVRLRSEPFRLSINDKYKEMGTVVMGKIESGVVSRGQSLVAMPNKTMVEVLQVFTDSSSDEVESAEPGDNVRLKLKGIEEEDVRCGFVLCDPADPVSTTRMLEAQLVVLEHKSIICPGYSAVLHVHNVIEECVIEHLVALIDRKTNKVTEKRPKFVRPGQVVRIRLSTTQPICIEPYSEFPQLGRFILRDEGKTIAVGIVTRLPPKEKR